MDLIFFLLIIRTLASSASADFPQDPSAPEIAQLAVKSGYLHKRGGGTKSKAWKKRWFSLFGQTFFYYKSDKVLYIRNSYYALNTRCCPQPVYL